MKLVLFFGVCLSVVRWGSYNKPNKLNEIYIWFNIKMWFLHEYYWATVESIGISRDEKDESRTWVVQERCCFKDRSVLRLNCTTLLSISTTAPLTLLPLPLPLFSSLSYLSTLSTIFFPTIIYFYFLLLWHFIIILWVFQ